MTDKLAAQTGRLPRLTTIGCSGSWLTLLFPPVALPTPEVWRRRGSTVKCANPVNSHHSLKPAWNNSVTGACHSSPPLMTNRTRRVNWTAFATVFSPTMSPTAPAVFRAGHFSPRPAEFSVPAKLAAWPGVFHWGISRRSSALSRAHCALAGPGWHACFFFNTCADWWRERYGWALWGRWKRRRCNTGWLRARRRCFPNASIWALPTLHRPRPCSIFGREHKTGSIRDCFKVDPPIL